MNDVTSSKTPTQKEFNTKYYNNQKYEINIILSNSQGNDVRINIASLVSLEIEEDTRSWYKKAALVLNNPNNALEYRQSSSTPKNQYYKFRNDGRDIVYIEIKPVDDSILNKTALNIDYDVWGMRYKFVIYDKKEILPTSNDAQKQLKLYLWEYDYQLMAEANLDWSTNELLPSNIIPSQATDEEKRVKTGLAIKSLIKAALKDSAVPKFADDWDVGASKIFYSSYAYNNAKDDLEYLLKKHVSAAGNVDNGNDLCALTRTRYNQIWSLRSFANIFSKAISKGSGNVAQAGEFQREILTLVTRGGDDEKNSEVLFTMPVVPSNSSTNKNTNYSDPTRSGITSIQYVDMAPIDNMDKVATSPCYSYNHLNKAFEVNFTVNEITAVKKFVDNNYTQKFKIFSKPDTLLTLNKVKTETKTVNNVFSYAPDKTSQLADSRNLMLMALIYLNSSINFEAPGSTIRQSTSFIAIQDGKKTPRDEFRNKLLGQWFVYRVIHKFTNDEYTNNITAVRIHANDNIDIKDNIT